MKFNRRTLIRIFIAAVLVFVLAGTISLQRSRRMRKSTAGSAEANASSAAAPGAGSPQTNRLASLAPPVPNGFTGPVRKVTIGAISNTNMPAVNTPADDNGKLSTSALSQIAALESEKAARTPVERKIDSQLLYADKMRQGIPVAPGLPVQRVTLDEDARNRVLVDVKAVVTDKLLEQIRRQGGEVVSSFPQYQAVRAAVPLAGLEELAANPDVQFIKPAVRALHSTVTSEGDTAHQANTARATFGAIGTGVRVGVLSDSVDYLTSSKIAGLVTVVPGQDGLNQGNTGEGTAMLEIVHDLAPGAQLFFATANGGTAQFATNILQLRFNYGCDIIVDDVGYYDESPFQDATVAQAVNTVTTSGGLYFSSAANSGNLDNGTSGTWEGDFVNDGASGPMIGYGYVHRFGSSDFDTITQSSSESAPTVLFWSDPLGASDNDYDLFILDSNGVNVVDSSTDVQNGTQDPVESVAAPNVGEQVVVVLASGSGRFLHLDTERGTLALGTRGSTRGHNAATNGFCVAAVDVADTVYPAGFAGGSQDPVEAFSSDGPRRMFYQPDGTAITAGNFSSTGGAVFQKPDLTAADGVTTDVPGFAPFFGTSAAAPHAAAIAALLKSYRPGLTAAQIRTILTSSALDIMAPGADPDAGAGIVMAPPALQAAFPDALLISPQTGLISSGTIGGPFTPTVHSLVLSNAGPSSLNWSLVNTSLWLNVSPGSGILGMGGTVTVTANLNAATTDLLPPGVYESSIGVTNANSGMVQWRQFTLLVQAGITHAPNPDAVLAFSPLAYWRLNETNPPPPTLEVTNSGSLGISADGFLLGGASSGQTGIVGNCVRFYNPNLSVPYFGSRVDISYSTNLNPNGPFTVEFWAKPAQLTTDLFCPASAMDATQNGGTSRSGWIFYQAADNTWQFRVGGFSGYAATLSGGTAQANVWQHIVGVFDGTYVRLYVNGQLVAGPTPASGFAPNPSQPLRLGATTIPNRTYDGWVDEAAFYPMALSAGQIAAHYAAATTNNAGYAAQILADHPAGYWRLDNATNAAPGAGALPVAFNSGTASNVFGLYEPGSIPGVSGVPYGGFGSDNRACEFNGIAGCIEVPGSALNITGPLTVLAWIKANPDDGNFHTIISGGEISFHLGLDPGGYPDFGDGVQPGGDIYGFSSISDGQWHQLAGVYDGVGSEQLYVDGQLVDSTSDAILPPAGSAGDVWIGDAPDHAASEVFSGAIDEVAIFTSAFSPSQIQQIYSVTNAPITITASKANGTVALTWNAVSGLNYQVQFKTNLTQATWFNLGTIITATNSAASTLDVIGPDSRRFYRVMVSQ